jgi:hypothetical protein
VIPLTFQHRAGVSPYTSAFALAETCVFVKQLLGPILCGLPFGRHPLFRSYGVNLPSSLTIILPLVLGFSPHLPVSVCGTGTIVLDRSFSWQCGTRYLSSRALPHHTSSLIKRIFLSNLTKCLDTHPIVCTSYPSASLHFSSELWWYRNINRLSITYAFRPQLRPRLTLSGRAFLRKP